MKAQEVRANVEEALRQFVAVDNYLLAHNLSERCIASRLALHLQRQFADYSVDVEYNRTGQSPKRLGLPDECANSEDEDGNALVVPDIIVHRRGSEGPNLLAIEVKKVGDRRGTECDRMRIHALKRQLNYANGALLLCETRRAADARIYISEWF